MNEKVLEILERSVVKSEDKKQFSTPAEITSYVNMILTSAYSTKIIAQSLQSLGWQCTKNPMKRDGKTCRYYFKENLDGDISFAYLKQNDENGTRMDPHPHQDTADDESLSEISRRYKSAQADKERHLSNTRRIETKTAAHRESHLEIQLAKERRSYVSIADVVRDWEIALTHLRLSLYQIAPKYGARWASMTSETEIQEEIKKELDVICERLATAGKDVISVDGDEQFQTKEKIQTTEVTPNRN